MEKRNIIKVFFVLISTCFFVYGLQAAPTFAETQKYSTNICDYGRNPFGQNQSYGACMIQNRARMANSPFAFMQNNSNFQNDLRQFSFGPKKETTIRYINGQRVEPTTFQSGFNSRQQFSNSVLDL